MSMHVYGKLLNVYRYINDCSIREFDLYNFCNNVHECLSVFIVCIFVHTCVLPYSTKY